MNLRMSAAWPLNRLLFRLKMDDTFYPLLREDMERYIKEYELSDGEADALRSRDPARLLEVGGHPLLVRYILRIDPRFEHNIYWTQV